MKFQSLSRFLVALLLLGSAALVSSCGGGGGSTANPPTAGNDLFINPAGTAYAGIPYTMFITGGRPPYTLTSSEPSLFPIENRTSANTVTIVPNNPGVIDADLQDGELPSRSVNIFVRDSTGLTGTATVRVSQNFLTGYGVVFNPVLCPEGQQACAGSDSAVVMQATFAGNLFGNQPFRFEVLRGNFSLRNPATGQVAQSITLNSDHTGTVTGLITVPPGTPTQLAVLRVIHVPTGVYADHVFVINSVSITNEIVALPDRFTFEGPLVGICGTGVGDFFVFDGTAPYTAVSSNPQIVVTPSVSTSNPARFTVTVNGASPPCPEGTIIVTDATGARTTVTVTSEEGTTEPPAPPDPVDLVVGPTAITLGCGQSGSVTVAGGSGFFSVNSTSPSVTATVSGNTVTISRAGPAGPGSGTLNGTISITDGSQIVTVAVTAPANCP